MFILEVTNFKYKNYSHILNIKQSFGKGEMEFRKEGMKHILYNLSSKLGNF